MKMKANKTRNELKVSDSNTYRLKNEEWWRTVENLHRFAHGNISEALRKHFDSIFLHGNVFFLPKIAEMHSLGSWTFLKQPPSPIYREKRRCLPPRGFLRKISKHTPITKFTPLFVLYRKVMEALQKCFGFDFHLFFLFPFTNIKWNMLTQGFQKFYGSITEATEALETIFQQRGGACHPVAFSISNPTSKMFQKGLDLNCYLHPYLDKFTPRFCVFGCFLSKISWNFTDSAAMSVKPSEVINNGPRMKLECNSLFTHTPLF